MKAILKIMSIAMCLFFLLAGTGINAVHYCCSDCRHAGIEHLAEGNCCDVHHECTNPHHHHEHDAADGECHHHHSHCWIKHLQVELTTLSQSIKLPHAQDLQVLHCITPIIQISDDCNGSKHLFRFSTAPPPHLSGRQIQTSICRWTI